MKSMLFDQEANKQRQKYLALYDAAKSEVQKVIIGLDDFFASIFICFTTPGRMPGDPTGSHLLVEASHGLGKSKMIMVVARPFELSFKRIQCDPELQPSDIRGSDFPDPNKPWAESKFKPGPIFTDLCMTDEINRAPTRTQAAFLQAMEERMVSLGDETHLLSEYFRMIATINPYEEVGTATYVMPAAQIDRFLINQKLTWLSPEQEEQVIAGEVRMLSEVKEDIITKKDLKEMSEFIEKFFFDPLKKDASRSDRSRIITLCQQIVSMTRLTDTIEVPASTRAGIDVKRVAASLAFLSGEDIILPSHVAKSAQLVLPKRLLLVDQYSQDVEQEIVNILDRISII